MKWVAVILLVSAFGTLQAQKKSDQQLWLDYQVAFPFANSYLFDTEVSYQTLLSQQDKWRSLHVTPGIQKNMLNWLDLMFSTPLYYTAQTSTYNTFEVRLSPAARFDFSPSRRIESWSVLRYDLRYVKPGSGAWQVSNRVRLELEFVIPINGKTIYTDKLYYVIVDGEVFFVVDQNITERFANARKARIGVGYRPTYRYRFEVIYQAQASRQTIDQEFETFDHIIRLRFKMYFNSARKAPTTETN